MKSNVDPKTIRAEKPSPEEYPVEVLDEPINDVEKHAQIVTGSSKSPDPENPFFRRWLWFGLGYIAVVLLVTLLLNWFK